VIYFVHGPDALLVREHVRSILDQADPEAANTTRIDGRSTPVAKIAPMVATPGFFGDGRVIVVDDLFGGRSSKKSSGQDDESAPAEAASEAVELLLHVVEPNTLIVVEPSLASVPVAVKKRAPSIDVRSGVAPRGNVLVSWVMEQAKQAGSSIDQPTAVILLNAVSPGSWQNAASNPRYDAPPDLDMIQQEIHKLAAYAYPNPIDRKAVSAMTVMAVADQLFPFLSAMFGGETDQAIKLLSDALDRGDDQFRLVAQVMQQVELSVPLEAAKGRSPESVGSDLGVPNPRRMVAIERSTRVHPVTPIHDAVINADRDQKRGRLRTADDVLFAVLAATASAKQKRTRR
jgi:DNA polymerase III delta subunit